MTFTHSNYNFKITNRNFALIHSPMMSNTIQKKEEGKGISSRRRYERKLINIFRRTWIGTKLFASFKLLSTVCKDPSPSLSFQPFYVNSPISDGFSIISSHVVTTPILLLFEHFSDLTCSTLILDNRDFTTWLIHVVPMYIAECTCHSL